MNEYSNYLIFSISGRKKKSNRQNLQSDTQLTPSLSFKHTSKFDYLCSTNTVVFSHKLFLYILLRIFKIENGVTIYQNMANMS